MYFRLGGKGRVVRLKIAASDFDGTLHMEGEGVSEENIRAIKRWQEAGNKFGLVTGRNRHLVRIGLSGYDIRLDFCVGLNGAVVYDAEGRQVFGAEMPPYTLRELWKHVIVKESPYVMTLQGDDSFVRWNDPDWEDPLRNAGITEVTPEEAVEIPHVIQMCFAARSPERAEELAKDLNKRFAGILSAEVNLFYVDVCAIGNDKGTGLEHLRDGMGWREHPLYVIGDDLNDISMIERFRGFAMEPGNAQVREKASRVFPSVGAMLDAMLEERESATIKA